MAETMCDPLLGKYRTYGIQANGKTEEGWEPVQVVHDVSTELQFAERLSDLFSLHQLSPIHLRDVVEDMLP